MLHFILQPDKRGIAGFEPLHFEDGTKCRPAAGRPLRPKRMPGKTNDSNVRRAPNHGANRRGPMHLPRDLR